MSISFLSLIPLIGFFFFAYRRLLTYLHIFQQEEYNPQRFTAWLFRERAFDTKMSFIVFGVYLLSLFMGQGIEIQILLTLLFLGVGFKEADPTKTGKKKLVLTDRAKRILIVSFGLFDIVAILVALFAPSFLYWIFPIHVLPFALATSVMIMASADKKVNDKYRQEAIEKLEDLDPYVVAITGSFGKTSVKHILGHVLQSYAPTLITPGSVNTEMGITRIIREQLQPQHKYFIVEMGAYGPGSISRLCALTPPKLSALTAVGHAHYERFKTLETVAEAKFEIAHAAKDNGGKSIIHSSVLERDYAQKYISENKDQVIICGDEGLVILKKSKQTAKGLDITLRSGEEEFSFLVPLYGAHHAGNVTIAFTIAFEMGMQPADIVNALKTTPQINHRLEVKETGNYTIIDDAYNSNPKGFSSALELLDMLGKDKKGRRILVTPGMIEMGADHDSSHAILGKEASEKTDITILVQAERIESFAQAYLVGEQGKLICVESFAEAQEWMNKNLQANDVVLLENDLPDLFEKKLKL